MKYWKLREISTGFYSLGGIDAEFDSTGRKYTRKIGVKGTLFHYVYGFQIDNEGIRRFHPRGLRTVDDYEAVCFLDDKKIEIIPGRDMFTRNQLLNKKDRILHDLSPFELKEEMKKLY